MKVSVKLADVGRVFCSTWRSNCYTHHGQGKAALSP